MENNRWFLALSFTLLSAVSAHAQVLQGTLVVSQD